MVNYILSKSPNGLFLIFERSVQFDFTIRQKDSNINLYDLRTPIEFASGHIPESHNLPFEELKYFNDPKNETYYFICRSGDLSHHVCQLLKSKGYNNLINISDGILNWKGKIQSIN